MDFAIDYDLIPQDIVNLTMPCGMILKAAKKMHRKSNYSNSENVSYGLISIGG